MKQHLIVFKSQQPSFFKEYQCLGSSYLQFDFKHRTNTEKEIVDYLEDLEMFNDQNAEVDRENQVFEFVETPSFVTFFT